MKPASVSIYIPEPCHEDWEHMQPDAGGKFCHTCCSSVYDFSDKSPDEIRDMLTQHPPGKICGYFRETQLDKPLPVIPDKRMTGVTKRFFMALYLVFGSLLFSCKTVPEPEQESISSTELTYILFKKGKTRIVHPESDSARNLYGKAIDMIYLTEETTDSVTRTPD